MSYRLQFCMSFSIDLKLVTTKFIDIFLSALKFTNLKIIHSFLCIRPMVIWTVQYYFQIRLTLHTIMIIYLCLVTLLQVTKTSIHKLSDLTIHSYDCMALEYYFQISLRLLTDDNLLVTHLKVTKAPIYQFTYIFLLKMRPTAIKHASRYVFLIFLF